MTTPEKMIIALLVIIILVLLNCWLNSEMRLRWYSQKYYQQPRIVACPHKQSFLNRLVRGILNMQS